MPFSKQSLRRVLGVRSSIAPWVWRDEYEVLHPPADPLSIAEGEEEQTYRQFLDMARREPNERGTGRWKLEQTRRTIAILPLGAIENERIERIHRYLQAFFHGLTINACETSPPARLSMNKKSCYLKCGKKWRLKQINVGGVQHLEVFSVLDVLSAHFLESHHYCLVALSDVPLCEEWRDDDGTDNVSAVMGRACGDRVCVVEHDSSSTEKALLATLTHELLHCFGMDHCTTFRCVMNSQAVEGDDCLFLSPLNLKKWIIGVMGVAREQAAAAALARYKAMSVVLGDFEGFEKECEWLGNKVKLVEKALEVEQAEGGNAWR